MNHPNPFCDNCGAPINPGACFCGACGQALDGEPAATAPNMTFWLLVPFIPMVNFLACWFAPMRIGHKFFMLGIVIVFWTCVLVPEICKSAAYCFVGCFFVVFYYVALIIGRKRQQAESISPMPACEKAPARGNPVPSLLAGLLTAGALGGAMFWLLREEPSPGDAYDALSPAEKEKKFHELFPDMTEDTVKPEKIKEEKLNPGGE